MDKSIKSIIATSAEKNYDIIIGNKSLELIKKRKDILSRDRFALLINKTVYNLYKDYILGCFNEFKNYDIYLIDDGEENKSYRKAENAFNWMLKKGFSRKSAIVGIGGGVVGDFSGFVAALFMRGIPVIHVPTTLLAMVDSSIGGKTAVNISAGKNIIGAFHQPEMVISDMNFLNTLPDNEYKNGLTEALKHALIGEDKLYKLFCNNSASTIKSPDNIMEVVYRSAIFKSGVVSRDEREGGLRAILNFGHSIGHAIESLFEYKGISHGEAVAIGLKIELEVSRRMGMISDDETKKSFDLIDRYGLIFNKLTLDSGKLLEHIKYDKKNVGGEIRCVLLKGIGKPVYNHPVSGSLIKEILDDFIL
jgi:3-dehydroquinate synthase